MQQPKWSWRVEGAREAVVVVVAVAFFGVVDFGLERQEYLAAMGAPLRTIAAPVVEFVGSHQRLIRPMTRWFRQDVQLKQLTTMLAESEAELAELGGVRRENEELRQLLENRHLDLQERRLGRTIASYASPSLWLGKDTDVAPGSLVLHKGVLLGRISEVAGGVGQVDLLAESSGFSVMVQVGSAVGVTRMESGRFIVANLPPDFTAEAGERVVTVGQQGVQPDLLVGLTTGGVEYVAGEGQVPVNQLVSFFETAAVEILPIGMEE